MSSAAARQGAAARADAARCRRIGEQLAAYLGCAAARPSPAALQALVADLVADQQQLLLPLKDLVARPAFLALLDQAGRGTALLQRDALLAELSATFAPAVLLRLTPLLNGFLGLADSTSPRGGGAVGMAPGAAAVAAATPASVQVPVSAPSGMPVPVPLAPAPAAPAVVQPAPSPAVPPLRPAAASGLNPVVLLLSAVCGALLVAAVVIARQSGLLCSSLGVCPPQALAPTPGEPAALTAARDAEQRLRVAASLPDFKAALQALEQQLLGLSPESLTSEQQRQWQELQTVALQGRSRLSREADDQARLERATAALQQARSSISPEAMRPELSRARTELEAIAADGFAAEAARQLLQELQQLEQVAGGADAEATPAPAPGEEVEGSAGNGNGNGNGAAETPAQTAPSLPPPVAPPAAPEAPRAPQAGAGTGPSTSVASGSSRYSLPRSWEERRERRREIMRHYQP